MAAGGFARALACAAAAVALWKAYKILRELMSVRHHDNDRGRAALRDRKAEPTATPTPHAAGVGGAGTQRHDLFERYFKNKHGLWLYHRKWLPSGGDATAVRGCVFITHGFGEHCGRYEHVAAALTSAGFAVFALDHQGHGQSEGDRAHVDCFDDYVDDVLLFARHIMASERFKARPAFLLGHSMGGTIAIQTARADPSLWSGLVVSGPAVKADPEVATPLLVAVGKVLARIMPKLGVTHLPPGLVSRSRDVVLQYELDPLVYKGPIRAKWAAELLRAQQDITDHCDDIRMPLLACHGTADRLCLPEGSRHLVAKASSADKRLIEYDGLFHEIFNEPERARPIGDVVEWLCARTPSPPTGLA